MLASEIADRHKSMTFLQGLISLLGEAWEDMNIELLTDFDLTKYVIKITAFIGPMPFYSDKFPRLSLNGSSDCTKISGSHCAI